MAKKFPTYRCKQSFTGDLEYTMYKFVAGKTYTDNGTTVMDVYLPLTISSQPIPIPARS